MGDLSEHFSRHEFECPCCKECHVDEHLISALEELRKVAGGGAIIVVSGYRCPDHNNAVGGSPTSLHLVGKAADIRIKKRAGSTYWSETDMYLFAMMVDAFRNGGIGIMRQTIHVDVRGYMARWGKMDGKYCLFKEALINVAKKS